ncbi:LytTR family DNA-binding domain-containing protein [Fulvivirgaceae bacterium BMA10]|uniref:LytTR family DNA-binding domain-containing protein n=1 Tax=Splendidivirga corallicola TaxID=3051826 RepID=A0ABT8KUX5_9BACT|nr:LytTR family DNA-binding domain-containing protein [Fulvivirgaceae bacterium BMA10]
MKVLIIEDEKMAANRLEQLLLQHNPTIEVMSKIDSVKKSVKWFQQHNSADLIFMDIQLADGLSFEIFEQVNIQAPVIFTTAYNDYALKAFKVNSIDYLLKPIAPEELAGAFKKLEFLSSSNKQDVPFNTLSQVEKVMQMLTSKYKNRFIVKIGEHIHSLPVEDILYFFSFEKATFLKTQQDKRYIIDYTLEQVESSLNPESYFRINRKYLIHIDAIMDIVSYSNSRLKIKLKYSDDNDVIVSREKVQNFKQWLDR